ncbi:hypothetical protein GALMADRAFT_57722 [Galerina marginata CBS 339.88]|uniref:Transcription factor CBF/NF-Y/archaeal histone domain-containing protein n=1 Tax=Galerina marginata (strain CBS 339.88) TaxID=685588 RepID=A0A067THE9_GALM3|nr:hypothetical protein GALMADRAFT_57722 [Galerina marginata CBS 339.88]
MKSGEGDPEPAVQGDIAKKRQKREPVELVREPGKSLLPFSRVQNIIKADKEIPIVAKEATFLISLATEEFIRRLTEAGHQVAHREKRSTVQHRDIEVMPWTSTDAPAKRPKTKATDPKAPTLLDQFVVSKKSAEEDAANVIMNDDGTMYAGNPVEYEQ